MREVGGRRTGVLLRAHGAVGEEADPNNRDAAEGFRILPSASYTSTCTSSVRCGARRWQVKLRRARWKGSS